MSSRRSRKRRQVDRHDVEPVVQIFAKPLGLDLVHQVAVAGGDHAGIDANGLRVADPFELSFLQHAQQLDLQLGRGGVDFVEEHRAGVGRLEAAGAVLDRAGERPADVAEQFAFQQAFASAPQLTRTNGPLPRGLSWWMALAISSLPVPVSPSSSTEALDRATRRVRV